MENGKVLNIDASQDVIVNLRMNKAGMVNLQSNVTEPLVAVKVCLLGLGAVVDQLLKADKPSVVVPEMRVKLQ